jgi:hypothetical protein
MKKAMLLGFAASVAMIGAVKADPVPLSSYADANGFIDVQTLTCGQLANTYQEDANARSPPGTAAGTTASPTSTSPTSRRVAKSSTR